MSALIITGASYIIGLTPIIPGPTLTRRERERASAHLLAAMILDTDCTIGHHPDGAPFITGLEDKTISISHSTTTCALGLTSSAVRFGIDVETPRQQLERVKTKFLTAEEAEILDAIGPSGRRMEFLLKCWTAKEAVYKAARTPGLGLKEIRIDPTFTHASTPDDVYRLSYHAAGGELICVAVERGLS